MDLNNDELLGTIYGNIREKKRKMLGGKGSGLEVFNNMYVSRFQIDVKI
jgi:hypothetical protein